MEDIQKVQDSSSSSDSGSGLLWMVALAVALVVMYGMLNKTTTKTQTVQPVTTISTPAQSQAPATGGTTIYGPPTLTAAQINTILAAYHSPAQGQGQALYDLGKQYGVDPAFALAFFMHESTLGTAGEARTTLALGNERCITDRPCVDQNRGGYAQFNSWQDGFAHWFELVSGPVYRGAGLTTVQSIIPKYAPTADNNNEQGYINSLLYCVNSWRSGKVII